MKKRVLLVLVAIMAIWQSAFAYDFSAISPSGHTLYYNINGSTVTVTYPGTSYANNYFGYTMPTGNLIIPNSAVNNGTTYTVTNIGGDAFKLCTGLTSVTIANTVTDIGEYAFSNCHGLTSITFSNTLTNIGVAAFLQCINLTSVTIPSTVTSIGDNAFRECGSLTYISVGSGNTHYDSRDNCNAIIETSSNVLIAGSNSTIIPNTVTGIGNYAFSNHHGLTSVIIPNSVVSIGNHAFYGCNNLTEIISHAIVAPTLGNDAFLSVPTTANVYIPCESLISYSTRWTHFSDFIISPSFSLTISSVDSNMGGANITNVMTCYSVQIYAEAATGYHFTHWSNGSTANPDTLFLVCDSIVTAFFEPNRYFVRGTVLHETQGYVMGSDTVNYLDTVVLTAIANYGYHFSRWNDYNSDNPRLIVATDNINLTAIFDYNQYIITVDVDSSIHGTCTGGGSYNYLSTRTIQAYANYGYHFAQWNNGTTDNPRIITLTCDTIFTAFYLPNRYTLTLLVNDNNSGFVNGAGEYNYLDTVEITATAVEHSHFVRWNDGNTDNPRNYVVAGNATLTAYFAIDTHIVSVQSSDIARGSVSGGGEFVYGTPCTVEATAYSGYTFAGWSNGVMYNPYTFAVLSDVELTALFVAEGEEVYTVTVVSADPTMGSVSGGGQAMYGGEVTIRAIANDGYRFVRWNDNDTHAVRTVTVTADATYTAYFESTTQGITDVNEGEVRIYAADGRIHVIYADEPSALPEIRVYDLMGREVFHATHADETSALPGGVYLVKVGTLPAKKVVVIR